MAALDAGFDVTVSGVTLDRFCGSGLTAANMAAAQLMSGMEDLLIAGGIGIAPILSMARYLDKKGKMLRIIYVSRSPEESAYLDDLKRHSYPTRRSSDLLPLAVRLIELSNFRLPMNEPIDFAQAFISSTNASSEPATCSAIATHASLPDWMMMPLFRSLTLTVVPTSMNILEESGKFLAQAFLLMVTSSSGETLPLLIS